MQSASCSLLVMTDFSKWTSGDFSAQVSKKLKELPTGKDRLSKRKRKQLFRDIDGNGNGILSLAEADNAVRIRWEIDAPRDVINRAFHGARDLCPPVAGFSDDYIDYSEFRIFMVYLSHYHDLRILFDKLDTSGDGRLGLEEFTQSVPLLQSWGLSVADPRAMFSQMDADGGGMVLFDEFAHWALHAGVADLATDADERGDALDLLRNAQANVCCKDFDESGHSRFSVLEGISGQGALAPSKGEAGRQILAGALDCSPGRSRSAVLVVTVHQAKNLRIADRTTSDPYVVLAYADKEASTRTIKRNLNPIWEEVVRICGQGGDDLEINVYDYDVHSSDDFLGRVVIDEKALSDATGRRTRYSLTGELAQGTIDLSFKWAERRR